jgi:hypothetical protein
MIRRRPGPRDLSVAVRPGAARYAASVTGSAAARLAAARSVGAGSGPVRPGEVQVKDGHLPGRLLDVPGLSGERLDLDRAAVRGTRRPRCRTRDSLSNMCSTVTRRVEQ